MEKKTLIFLTTLLIITVIRIFLFYYFSPKYSDGQKLFFTSEIISNPKTTHGFETFSVHTTSGQIVYVGLNKPLEYQYGDVIKLSGNLKIKLLNDKFKILTLTNPKIVFIKNADGNLLAVVNSIRQKIIKSFNKELSQDSSALLLGIVFGIRQDMSPSFLSNLKTAGVMHVIAASGMNVTLVAGFIFYFFAFFIKRQIAIFITIIGIIFYALLAGFEPSIIRASFMGIIAFSAQGFGRQQNSLYALAVTGLIMLIIWPNFLFDIGFQLSFASTMGILFIPVLLKSFLSFLSEDFTTTISAQIATLPILLSNFGTYSPWSIVTNVFVLWTIPFIMILGGIAAIFSFVFTPISALFISLCIPILAYFQEVVMFFGNLGGKISFENIPWQITIAYYLFLLSVFNFLVKKRKENIKNHADFE